MFTSLSTDDQTFINKYFTVDSSYETQEFFVENQKKMDEENVVIDHNSKTASEYIYHEILKTCDDFKTEKLISKLFSMETIKPVVAFASGGLVIKYGVPIIKKAIYGEMKKDPSKIEKLLGEILEVMKKPSITIVKTLES